jgi:uncharacterized coiled-coil DUF342 family protein
MMLSDERIRELQKIQRVAGLTTRQARELFDEIRRLRRELKKATAPDETVSDVRPSPDKKPDSR